MKMEVKFLRVKDNTIKLQRLCQIIQGHFRKGEAVLITVPSDDVANYVDQLLWRMPAEGFMPHGIAHGPTKDLIAITKTSNNVNQAKIVFNLRSEAISHLENISTAYELLDQTSPEKEEASRQRMTAYQARSLPISEI